MKISVVSDVHLKLRRNAEFELNRFELLITHIQESNADIIIFNGDLLDVARPTLEEIRALNIAMDKLHEKAVYIVGGNHEAVTKDTDTYDYIHLNGKYFNVEPIHKFNIGGTQIALCAWKNIHKLHLVDDCHILITHYRSKMEGLYDEEIDTSKFIDNYDLVLLGDIHSRYSPAPNVFYTGSPYPIHHITDSRVPYGYVSLDIDDDTGEYSWAYVDLDLPKKIKLEVAAKELDEVILNGDHMYKIVIKGTLDEVSDKYNSHNVTYVKDVLIEEAKSTTDIQELDFFDTLTEKVDEQLTNKTKKTKQVLLNVQGG